MPIGNSLTGDIQDLTDDEKNTIARALLTPYVNFLNNQLPANTSISRKDAIDILKRAAFFLSKRITEQGF